MNDSEFGHFIRSKMGINFSAIGDWLRACLNTALSPFKWIWECVLSLVSKVSDLVAGFFQNLTFCCKYSGETTYVERKHGRFETGKRNFHAEFRNDKTADLLPRDHDERKRERDKIKSVCKDMKETAEVFNGLEKIMLEDEAGENAEETAHKVINWFNEERTRNFRNRLGSQPAINSSLA